MSNRASAYSKAACSERSSTELRARIEHLDALERDIGPLVRKLNWERQNCDDELARRGEMVG